MCKPFWAVVPAVVGVTLLASCSMGASVESQIAELEAAVDVAIEERDSVSAEIGGVQELLDTSGFEGDFDSDAQYEEAVLTLGRLQELANQCGGDSDQCGVLAELPVDRVDLSLSPAEQVPAKVQFANEVMAAAQTLVNTCGRIPQCTVVTTTTRVTTTTTPRASSSSSGGSSSSSSRLVNAPECENVILARALALMSDNDWDEIDYLMTAAYSMPYDWSLTANLILDDLAMGLVNSAYSRVNFFVSQKCPNN